MTQKALEIAKKALDAVLEWENEYDDLRMPVIDCCEKALSEIEAAEKEAVLSQATPDNFLKKLHWLHREFESIIADKRVQKDYADVEYFSAMQQVVESIMPQPQGEQDK